MSPLNPIYPNPAISAHAVFPQSGYIHPEKRPFFQKLPHFFQNRAIQKVSTAPIYQINQYIQFLFSFDKSVSLGTLLNLNMFPNFEEIFGNHGKSWGNTAYWMKICGV